MNIVMLDKALHGVGNGWDYRKDASPKSIIIHTTNGAKFSNYSAEANFIYNAAGIGAHFLVGKQGQITQFLDTNLRAWHAGAVFDSRYNNNNSIGIECHYTPKDGGEGLWTPAMHNALTELVKMLIAKHKITSPDMIETHRKVAVPKGRKVDPSGFNDVDFYVWRLLLFQKPTVPVIRYRVVKPEINIRYSPRADIDNIVGTLLMGEVFESEALKIDEAHQSIRGINTWAHLTRGSRNGKPLDGLGFVHTSNLTIVG